MERDTLKLNREVEADVRKEENDMQDRDKH